MPSFVLIDERGKKEKREKWSDSEKKKKKVLRWEIQGDSRRKGASRAGCRIKI